MNVDLIQSRLSTILEQTDILKSLQCKSEIELPKGVENVIRLIRMSAISSLLELNNSDLLEELSPDEEDLLNEYEEYEIEEDDLKKKSKVVKEKYDVGITKEGFHYLK